MYRIPYLLDQKPQLLIVSLCSEGRLQFERGHCWREPSITCTHYTRTHIVVEWYEIFAYG